MLEWMIGSGRIYEGEIGFLTSAMKISTATFDVIKAEKDGESGGQIYGRRKAGLKIPAKTRTSVTKWKNKY